MEWRREGQHSAGNIDHKYADSRNMQEVQRSTNPGLTAGKQVSFKQVQEVYLVQMHRIEKSSWNRKIRDSRKW